MLFTCTLLRFQYVLAAATSTATKVNEETLTYLNQNQPYEIKLKKLGELTAYRGVVFRSVVRLCFHDRRLQFSEREQIALWEDSHPNDRILQVNITKELRNFSFHPIICKFISMHMGSINLLQCNIQICILCFNRLIFHCRMGSHYFINHKVMKLLLIRFSSFGSL